MVTRFKSLVVLASLGSVFPVTAGAAEYLSVYSGTITAGSDIDNVFGLSRLNNLAGLAFSAAVSYTTSIPGTLNTTSNSDEVTGGLNFGKDQVVSSVNFTVAGNVFTFSPDYYSDVYTSQEYLETYDYDLLGNSFQAYFLPNGSNGPTTFGIPFTSAGTGDTGGAVTQYSYLITGQDDIDFDATSISVSAVPEPNVWIMMVLGFWAIGFALRWPRSRDVVRLIHRPKRA